MPGRSCRVKVRIPAADLQRGSFAKQPPGVREDEIELPFGSTSKDLHNAVKCLLDQKGPVRLFCDGRFITETTARIDMDVPEICNGSPVLALPSNASVNRDRPPQSKPLSVAQEDSVEAQAEKGSTVDHADSCSVAAPTVASLESQAQTQDANEPEPVQETAMQRRLRMQKQAAEKKRKLSEERKALEQKQKAHHSSA
eukprot:6431132-Amphidinium_carterae.1